MVNPATVSAIKKLFHAGRWHKTPESKKNNKDPIITGMPYGSCVKKWSIGFTCTAAADIAVVSEKRER